MQFLQEIQKMNFQAQNLVNPNQIYCRICLEQEPKNSLISPCLCKGSTQYIHQQCLIEWSTKNTKHKYNPTTQQFELECQICRFQIPLDYQQDLQIRSCSKVLEVIKEEKFKFAIEIISIVCMAFCFFFMLRKYYDYVMMGDGFLIYITLGLAVFMGIGVIVLIGCMLYSYGVEMKEIFKVRRLQNITNDAGSAFQMNINPTQTS